MFECSSLSFSLSLLCLYYYYNYYYSVSSWEVIGEGSARFIESTSQTRVLILQWILMDLTQWNSQLSNKEEHLLTVFGTGLEPCMGVSGGVKDGYK